MGNRHGYRRKSATVPRDAGVPDVTPVAALGADAQRYPTSRAQEPDLPPDEDESPTCQRQVWDSRLTMHVCLKRGKGYEDLLLAGEGPWSAPTTSLSGSGCMKRCIWRRARRQDARRAIAKSFRRFPVSLLATRASASVAYSSTSVSPSPSRKTCGTGR